MRASFLVWHHAFGGIQDGFPWRTGFAARMRDESAILPCRRYRCVLWHAVPWWTDTPPGAGRRRECRPAAAASLEPRHCARPATGRHLQSGHTRIIANSMRAGKGSRTHSCARPCPVASAARAHDRQTHPCRPRKGFPIQRGNGKLDAPPVLNFSAACDAVAVCALPHYTGIRRRAESVGSRVGGPPWRRCPWYGTSNPLSPQCGQTPGPGD